MKTIMLVLVISLTHFNIYANYWETDAQSATVDSILYHEVTEANQRKLWNFEIDIPNESMFYIKITPIGRGRDLDKVYAILHNENGDRLSDKNKGLKELEYVYLNLTPGKHFITIQHGNRVNIGDKLKITTVATSFLMESGEMHTINEDDINEYWVTIHSKQIRESINFTISRPLRRIFKDTYLLNLPGPGLIEITGTGAKCNVYLDGVRSGTPINSEPIFAFVENPKIRVENRTYYPTNYEIHVKWSPVCNLIEPEDDHLDYFSQCATLVDERSYTTAEIRNVWGGDYDIFQFIAPSDTFVKLETTSSMDPHMELFSEDGNRIDSDDDSGNGYNSKIIASVIGGHRYFVKIRGHNTSQGDYGLSVRHGDHYGDGTWESDHDESDDFPDYPSANGNTITNDQLVPGEFEIPYDRDVIGFHFPAGRNTIFPITKAETDSLSLKAKLYFNTESQPGIEISDFNIANAIDIYLESETIAYLSVSPTTSYKTGKYILIHNSDGTTPNKTSSSCPYDFSIAHISNLQNPTCKDLAAVYYGLLFQQNSYCLETQTLKDKYDRILTTHKYINYTYNFAAGTNRAKTTFKDFENFAFDYVFLTPKIALDSLSSDQVNQQQILEIAAYTYDVLFNVADHFQNGPPAPSELALEAFNHLVTIGFAIYIDENVTKRLNSLIIGNSYIRQYYSYGYQNDNHGRVAESYGLPFNSSVWDVIKRIATDTGFTDYDIGVTLDYVEHQKTNVINPKIETVLVDF